MVGDEAPRVGSSLDDAKGLGGLIAADGLEGYDVVFSAQPYRAASQVCEDADCYGHGVTSLAR